MCPYVSPNARLWCITSRCVSSIACYQTAELRNNLANFTKGQFCKSEDLYKRGTSATVEMSAASSLMPGLFRRFGKKHVEIITQWLGPAATYGATAGIAVTYATDWKLILQYLPFYNGKFAEDPQ